MLPVITLSAMNPPLASPQLVFVSSIAAIDIHAAEVGSLRDAPLQHVPCEGGVISMFSMERQKFVVRLPLESV